MKCYKSKNRNGITLLGLVVTVIILIILAGVSINLFLSEDGIIKRATKAQTEYDIGRLQEKLELLKGPVLIDKNSVNLDTYLEELDKHTQEYKIDYVNKVNENNAYVVLEGKYRFLITDTEDGNVIIIYDGLASDLLTIQVTASPYSGTYDGNAHGITVTCNPSDAKIEYSTDGITYNTTNPTYTNAGTYTTYYRVTKTGYKKVEGSLTVTIGTIATATGNLTISPTSGTITYPNTTTFTVTKNVSGGALSVISSNSNIATATISGNTVTVQAGTTAGEATITVTSAATTNYEAQTATYTVTVENGTLNVTANAYTGTYDGNAHGITVTCTLSDALIEYSIDGITYSTTNPTYANVGTYTTYYRVSRAGYKTVQNSLKVTINPIPIANLKAGDYIKYDSGANGVITCRVLYPVSSQYGLQIISDKNVKTVKLGTESTWEAGKTAYNNAIKDLNNYAEDYINEDYAQDARCVGSLPIIDADGNFTEKDKGTTKTVTMPPSKWSSYTRPTGWTTDNTGCYDMDENYKTDQTQMNAFGIWTSGENYYLASRIVTSVYPDCGFCVRSVNEAGGLGYDGLCLVAANGVLYGDWDDHIGLRPCISLKSNEIKIVGNGDGKSADTAYEIGK